MIVLTQSDLIVNQWHTTIARPSNLFNDKEADV